MIHPWAREMTCLSLTEIRGTISWLSFEQRHRGPPDERSSSQYYIDNPLKFWFPADSTGTSTGSFQAAFSILKCQRKSQAGDASRLIIKLQELDGQLPNSLREGWRVCLWDHWLPEEMMALLRNWVSWPLVISSLSLSTLDSSVVEIRQLAQTLSSSPTPCQCSQASGVPLFREGAEWALCSLPGVAPSLASAPSYSASYGSCAALRQLACINPSCPAAAFPALRRCWVVRTTHSYFSEQVIAEWTPPPSKLMASQGTF